MLRKEIKEIATRYILAEETEADKKSILSMTDEEIKIFKTEVDKHNTVKPQ